MKNAMPPVLIKPFPTLRVNAGSPLPPLNLYHFISNQHDHDGEIQLNAQLEDASPLPKGIVLSKQGMLTGKPDQSLVNTLPYKIKIIGKNNAELPLISYIELFIYDSVSSDVQSAVDGIISRGLRLDELDEAYYGFFVEYMLLKFASVRFYNKAADSTGHQSLRIYTADSGWQIYDGDNHLTTTNPKAISSTFVKGKLIETLRSMIKIISKRAWGEVGVMGCYTNLCIRLINEHNAGFSPENPSFLKANIAYNFFEETALSYTPVKTL